jgi:2-methylisocitrate lyase-like PEP mutase family enzyme
LSHRLAFQPSPQPVLELPQLWAIEDGQHISRDMLIEALTRITRVVECPVTADIEAGYGHSIDEVVQTVKAVIETGVVGINIEDSLKQQEKALVDSSYQVELIKALRVRATLMDVPFVINARVDVFLLAIGEPESRFAHTVQRANDYMQAGADCIYPSACLSAQRLPIWSKRSMDQSISLEVPPHPHFQNWRSWV